MKKLSVVTAVVTVIASSVSFTVAAQSAGASAVSGASAMPGTQSGSHAMSFRDVDANGDGRITREEAQACPGLPAAFSSVDTQGRGYITESQFNDWQRKNGASVP